jgi:phospholipid/cholesterol/gamma-HCH transport system substrate-binding protein
MPTGPRSPLIRIAAAAALVAGAIVVAVLIFGGGSTYVIHARFVNASQLVKGDLVQVSGQKAGQVTNVDLAPDGEADVTLRIDDDFAPLRSGVTASVRLRSLLGEANRYVDLQLGSGTARALSSGAVLGADRTRASVDLDAVLDTLNGDARRSIRRFVAGSAQQFQGRGVPAGKGLAYLAPALSSTDAVTAELVRDRGSLDRLIRRGAGLARDVAVRRDDLRALVVHLADTADSLALRQQALGRGIAQLPGFLGEGTRTFARLRTTLDTLQPVVDESKPVAARLTPFLRTLRAFVTDARPTVGDLADVVNKPGAGNDLRDLLTRAAPLRDAATRDVKADGATREGALPASAKAIHQATPELAFARPYAVDLTGWFNDFGTSGVYDATGGESRASTGTGAFEHVNGVLFPIPPELRAQAFQRTATLGMTDRCPGSAERDPGDGSTPYHPKGFDCDPTQVPPGP